MNLSHVQKTLAGLLVGIMLVSGFCIAEGGPEPRADVTAKMSFLTAAGVISQPVAEDALDAEVLRSELAEAAVRMLGMYEDAQNYEGDIPFTDVHPMSKGAGCILTAYHMGWMSGNGTEFLPGNTVLFEEAVKVMVSAAGYQIYAAGKGGYPTGYMAVAAEIGVLSGVSGKMGKPLTNRELIQLLYNTVQADMMQQVEYGQNTKYEVQKDCSILSEYLNISKVKGQVTANEYTRLFSETGATSAGYVEISGELYRTGDTDAGNYLGWQVECYIKEDMAADQRTIVQILPNTKVCEAVTIPAEDINQVHNGVSLTFWVGGKTETAKLLQTANVIYNGRFYRKAYNITDNTLMPAYGDVTLLDADGDSVYEIVMVKDIRTMVVEGVNLMDEQIIDKYGDPLDVSTNGGQKVRITRDGSQVALNSLAAWDIVEVAQSKDGKVINATVTSEKIKGEVTTVGSEEVAIDGNSYKLAKGYQSEVLNLGAVGTFYLNASGQIAAADLSAQTSSEQYGILLEAALSSNIDPQLELKVYTEKGEATVFKAEQKIKLDGISGKTGAQILEVLKGGEDTVKRAIILFKTNEAGNITQLDTLNPDNGGQSDISQSGLTEWVPKASLKFKKTGTFGPAQFFVDNSTVIFSVPNLEAEDKEFSIATTDSLTNDKMYEVSAYDLNEYLTASAIIVYSSTGVSASGESNLFLVEKTIKSLEDGYEVIRLRGGYNNSITEDYWYDPSEDGMKALESGDLIQINAYPSGEIQAVRTLVDKNTPYGYVLDSETSNALTSAYGKVIRLDKSRSLVIVDVGNTSTPDLRVVNLTGCTGYCYKKDEVNGKQTGTVTTASINDIAINSVIYVRERYQEPKEFVIFE